MTTPGDEFDGIVRGSAAKVERAAARARRVGLTLVAMLVAVSLTVTTTLAWLVVQARQEARDRARTDVFGEAVILCVLDELGELRSAAQTHYREQSEAHAQRPRVTAPPLAEQVGPSGAERLARACQPILDELRKED